MKHLEAALEDAPHCRLTSFISRSANQICAKLLTLPSFFANSVSVSSPLLRLLFCNSFLGFPLTGFVKEFLKSIDFTRFLIDLTKNRPQRGFPSRSVFLLFLYFLFIVILFTGITDFVEKYAISTCEMTTFLFPHSTPIFKTVTFSLG